MEKWWTACWQRTSNWRTNQLSMSKCDENVLPWILGTQTSGSTTSTFLQSLNLIHYWPIPRSGVKSYTSSSFFDTSDLSRPEELLNLMARHLDNLTSNFPGRDLARRPGADFFLWSFGRMQHQTDSKKYQVKKRAKPIHVFFFQPVKFSNLVSSWQVVKWSSSIATFLLQEGPEAAQAAGDAALSSRLEAMVWSRLRSRKNTNHPQINLLIKTCKNL